jgi:hypothetical protein
MALKFIFCTGRLSRDPEVWFRQVEPIRLTQQRTSRMRDSAAVPFRVMPWFSCTRAITLLSAFMWFGLADSAYAAPSKETAAVRQAVLASLKDPSSAKFGAIEISGDFACVEVNARNGFGGYNGMSATVVSRIDGGWYTLGGEGTSLSECGRVVKQLQESKGAEKHAQPASEEHQSHAGAASAGRAASGPASQPAATAPMRNSSSAPLVAQLDSIDPKSDSSQSVERQAARIEASGGATPEVSRLQCAVDATVFMAADASRVARKQTNVGTAEISPVLAAAQKRMLEHHPMGPIVGEIALVVPDLVARMTTRVNEMRPNLAGSLAALDQQTHDRRQSVAMLAEQLKLAAERSCRSAGYSFPIISLPD